MMKTGGWLFASPTVPSNTVPPLLSSITFLLVPPLLLLAFNYLFQEEEGKAKDACH